MEEVTKPEKPDKLVMKAVEDGARNRFEKNAAIKQPPEPPPFLKKLMGMLKRQR